MIRRFRTTSLALALVTVTALAACGSSSSKASNTTAAAASGSSTTAAAPSTTAASGCSGPSDAYVKTIGNVSDFKPVKADTLTVVTSLPGPGFWEGSDTDPTKLKSGYEYDIAKDMETAFGLHHLVILNKEFDAIVAGQVTKSDYDVALSQISITCDRAKVVDFSVPYFQSNQGILVRAGTKVPDLAAAKALHWGVQTSTTCVDLLNKIGATNVQAFKDLPTGYTALQAGTVDAFCIDTAINLGEAARSNGKLQVVAQFNQPGGPDQYGAIIPKGSTNVGAINGALNQLITSGQLSALAKKDLTADPGTIPVITIPS
ncbi:MAG TPA: ABC transporter substrate-binding protein [Acidimicrobiia bacterium]|jgi:polar amino acid transport system substrate-binding protein